MLSSHLFLCLPCLPSPFTVPAKWFWPDLLILLPNPADNLVDALHKTVFQFVWKRKQDRISRKAAVRAIAMGGLRLPDIRNYISAFKLIWMRILNTTDHKWKSIIKLNYPKMILLEQLGSSLPTEEHNFSKVWCHVFKAYTEFVKKTTTFFKENLERFVAEPVFCNNNIRVGSRTTFFSEKLFFRKWRLLY